MNVKEHYYRFYEIYSEKIFSKLNNLSLNKLNEIIYNGHCEIAQELNNYIISISNEEYENSIIDYGIKESIEIFQHYEGNLNHLLDSYNYPDDFYCILFYYILLNECYNGMNNFYNAVINQYYISIKNILNKNYFYLCFPLERGKYLHYF
jgi:hypothetical protein